MSDPDPKHFAVYMPGDDIEGRILLTGDVAEDWSFKGRIETTGPIVIMTKEYYEALRDAAKA